MQPKVQGRQCAVNIRVTCDFMLSKYTYIVFNMSKTTHVMNDYGMPSCNFFFLVNKHDRDLTTMFFVFFIAL